MGKLNVIIVDATGNKERKVGLPDDVKIGIIMVKLIEKIKLPSTGPDGNPISYKFIHKVSGRQLLDACSKISFIVISRADQFISLIGSYKS